MSLIKIFKGALNETHETEEDRYFALRPKLDEYRMIFANGISSELLTVEPDGSISYDGEITFSNYTADEVKIVEHRLPFKFNGVNDFLLGTNISSKLNTLEGLPKEVKDYIAVVCSDHKPPSFYEGVFPKRVTVADIKFPELRHCRFGIEHASDVNLTVEGQNDLHSFEGLPNKLHRLTINAPFNSIRSYRGLPKSINRLEIYPGDEHERGEIDLKDLVEHAGEIKEIITSQNIFTEGTKLLSLFKIKGLRRFSMDNILVTASKKAINIVNRHLESSDVFECQEELIEAGLKEFAEY